MSFVKATTQCTHVQNFDFVLTYFAQVENRYESHYVVSNWGPARKCSPVTHRMTCPKSSSSSHPHTPIAILHSPTRVKASHPTQLPEAGAQEARRDPRGRPFPCLPSILSILLAPATAPSGLHVHPYSHGHHAASSPLLCTCRKKCTCLLPFPCLSPALLFLLHRVIRMVLKNKRDCVISLLRISHLSVYIV